MTTINRISLIILVLLPVSVSGFSQLSIGYGHGIRYSIAFAKPYADQKPVQGNVGLVSFDIKNESVMGARLEFGMAGMAWKQVYKSGAYQILELNTFEVPFLAQAEIGKGLIRVLLQVGVTSNYALSGNFVKPINSEDVKTAYETTDINFDADNIHKFYASIGGGIGLRVSTKFGMFSVETRISHSLIDIYKSYSGYDTSFTNIQSLTGIVYYQYPIIKLRKIL